MLVSIGLIILALTGGVISHKPKCKSPSSSSECSPIAPKAPIPGNSYKAEASSFASSSSSVAHSSSFSSSSSSSSSSSKVVIGGCGGKKCKDPNAIFKECPNPCPLTCDEPNPRPCSKMCLKEGCECASGFILDKIGGKCIRPQNCPGKKCKDPNAVFKECPNPCPLTCDEPNPRPCNRMCLKEGCECASGFILDKIGGKCIKPQHCPVPTCPKHATYVIDNVDCTKTCGNRLIPGSEAAGACRPFSGCVCDPGYVRKFDNGTGPCIPVEKCPPIPKNCGVNERPTSCRILCPPQSCDSLFTAYDCPEPVCEPGCDCSDNYLRNIDGICIPSDDCLEEETQECGPNEMATDCEIGCPPQSCESLYTTYMCAQMNCTPGCKCIDGYLRNSIGICIPSENCSTDSGCDGDINARRVECGSDCPPTCQTPDPEVCTLRCVLNACECLPGFIKTKKDGICIAPEDCPGGSPNCGANKTYVNCKLECLTNYCPTTDSPAVMSCALPDPCPGGCICKDGYLKLSYEDPRCILASECPDVGCNGDPNAIWSECTSGCPPTCGVTDIACAAVCLPPGCVCKPGFIRNGVDGRCVRPKDCPVNIGCGGDLNATYSECPTICPLTCSDPTREGKGCATVCGTPGCVCKDGFVKNEQSGQCIRLGDCPEDVGCNGDPNAIWSECTSGCPPTCGITDTACAAVCYPPGCECKLDFILDGITGRCVRPKDCPVDVGCGGDLNATYSECPTTCPLTCSDPSREGKGCPAVCGTPGCICKKGFVKNEQSGQCIRLGDCPVDVGCGGDLNATYSDCPSICTCSDQIRDGKACARVCGPPGCACNPGFYKNDQTGLCVRADDCPVEIGCDGDPNATWSECTSGCPPTCGDRGDSGCAAVCYPAGCVCKPEFILNGIDGRCVRPEDCPEIIGCDGDPNAIYNACPSNNCPEGFACPAVCGPPACECKPGFILNEESGLCVRPDAGCNGDPNAIWSECTSGCPPTCGVTDIACAAVCLPPGCVCKPGFIQNGVDGRCVEPKNCPADPRCEGDRNATFQVCPSPCQATCDEPDADVFCIESCLEDGCVCKPGFLRIEPDGECISPNDCPGGTPTCGANQTYVNCKVGCPTNYCPRDDSRGIIACSIAYPCPGGCACLDGYLFLSYEDSRCVLASECPPVECTRPNEVWEPTPSNCYFERCEDMGRTCDIAYLATPRCVCEEGTFRNGSDICVPASECPDVGCNGDPNAVYNSCPSSCPTTCADRNKKNNNVFCPAVCAEIPCVCKPGFIPITLGGKCVRPEECPDESGCNGDPNAMFTECPSPCEPTCDRPPTDEPCVAMCLDPGCVCKPEYIRLEKGGKCIKPEDCPGPLGCKGDRNATLRQCPSPCPLTCADQDFNKPCIDICLPPDCDCNPGYVRTEIGGKCILPEDCPADPRCHGDRNATFKECPSACQATCAKPNANGPCTDQCLPDGCVCKQGYLRTKKNGKCIRPEDCPGGSPTCGVNENYVYCKVGCPTNYCPVDDSLAEIACDPIFPCPGGCACKAGYLMISYENETCIKSSECPPVKCTRPNEEWNTNPPSCSLDRCALRNNPCDFPIPQPPRCTCIPGYFKNDDDICVPESECPPNECKGNATLTECPNPCPLTCADQGINKPCLAICLPPGCDCNPGYVLTEVGGDCILSEDCPADPRCEGDRNATFKECPSACQPTCAQPNADVPCTKQCLPDGCVCKQGYLRTKKNGKCIRPEDCPGGSPTCGLNETYVNCKVGCPTNYCPVDDSLAQIACDPSFPCPGGCACKNGYLRLNQKDKRCIKSSECPPVKCTRPNEKWNPNPPSCSQDRCAFRNIPCDFPIPEPPRCTCIPGYFRDDREICVPESECPPVGCNGDLNATLVDYPKACPATCCKPDSDRPCNKPGKEIGCQCNEGFLLDKPHGVCIRPTDCPGGHPSCCENMTYVGCKIECPTNYCPVAEGEILIICDPVWPCPSGCVCKGGYLMKDTNDRTCILSTECPSRECTQPNEIWSSSPPKCNLERCEDMNRICDDTSPGRPKCVCKEGYFKDQNGICILAADCPTTVEGLCSDPNAYFKECPSPCQASCGFPHEDVVCIQVCEPSGCVCRPGYLKNEGRCVKPEECPGGSPTCGANKTYVRCKDDCLANYCPLDDSLDAIVCPPRKYCPAGCGCKDGHLMTNDLNDRCILASECPPVNCTRPNEIWNPNPTSCMGERCDGRNPKCDSSADVRPNCVCKEGFSRNKSNICVPAAECRNGPPQMPQQPQCGFNEVAVDCRTICPPQNCEIAYTDYFCDESTRRCEPGCDCKPNHLRNGSGICILNDDCPYPTSPICGINEIARDCRQICPPQTCLSKYALFRCVENIPCEPGCDCVPGYLRDRRGVCIRSEDCPALCSVPDECKRTCERPNPPDCPYAPPAENIDGCDCKQGYVLSEIDGVCIEIETCPRNLSCNGDPHARIKQCPQPCPSTCKAPNAFPCKRKCDPIGCECESGYLLCSDTGMCLLPDQCPGGNPCGKSALFTPCKVVCPQDFCPVDDSRAIVACDPPPPEYCLSGCICKLNHKLKSREDRRCIVSSKCPEVNCTRPNEIWDPCPSACLAENCADRYHQPGVCNTLVLNCQPQCICKKGYFRDENDICIPGKKCPCPVPDKCKRTCARPNPECPYSPPTTNVDGCECKEGYILSKIGGVCIKIDQCPSELGCNGDPNARPKQCPLPCPSTCDAPNAVDCRKMCEPIGCECKDNYILSNITGKCILPDKCPGGNPCGKNSRFVRCKVECERDFCPVDDCRDVPECVPPKKCLSGCICNINHKRKSYKDHRCIVSSSCPPVPCTRPNEEWNSCPSACLAERCKDVKNQPKVCNTLILNCDPKCICKKNYFRNENDICIHYKHCPH